MAGHHYTSFLTATAWSESYPVVLAALLPCFWIYAEVGKDIVNKSIPNNPYQAWIDTYAGEEFHTAVRNVIATVDKVAARCDADTLEKCMLHIRWVQNLNGCFGIAPTIKDSG